MAAVIIGSPAIGESSIDSRAVILSCVMTGSALTGTAMLGNELPADNPTFCSTASHCYNKKIRDNGIAQW